MLQGPSYSERRPGGVAVPALLAFPAVLMGLVIALSARQFSDIRSRMQNEADAGAIAGIDALPGDAMLRGRLGMGSNSTELYALLEEARSEIQSYAYANPVYGGYSVPDWNLTSPSQGDIIFGSYDRTRSSPFAPVVLQDGMGNPASDLQIINSVRVLMRRTQATNNAISIPSMPLVGASSVDSITSTTAMLDGDLQGFRPLFPDRPIPIVPFALDYATINSQTATPFADLLRFDTPSQSFKSGQDQLPEITVNITTDNPPPGIPTTAVPLNIGITSAADVPNQVAGGIYAAQLAGAPFKGAFMLQPDPTDTTSNPPFLKLVVPGQQYIQAADGPKLEAAFNSIGPEFVGNLWPIRLWPIFDGFDDAGQPIIVGFMAAKLAIVQVTMDADSNVQAISLTLQPTMATAPCAVTNPLYRGYVGVPNLTIAKLRLVQ